MVDSAVTTHSASGEVREQLLVLASRSIASVGKLSDDAEAVAGRHRTRRRRRARDVPLAAGSGQVLRTVRVATGIVARVYGPNSQRLHGNPVDADSRRLQSALREDRAVRDEAREFQASRLPLPFAIDELESVCPREQYPGLISGEAEVEDIGGRCRGLTLDIYHRIGDVVMTLGYFTPHLPHQFPNTVDTMSLTARKQIVGIVGPDAHEGLLVLLVYPVAVFRHQYLDLLDVDDPLDLLLQAAIEMCHS
jgi:hypothetical protein